MEIRSICHGLAVDPVKTTVIILALLTDVFDVVESPRQKPRI